MAKFIDINKFSLQAMYRSRLIRAYLGASNGKPEINRFIGFDRTDNFYLKNLTPSTKPFHVVNMALNLVSGERLAWQQRRAASFTASPLTAAAKSLAIGQAMNMAAQTGFPWERPLPSPAPLPAPTWAITPRRRLPSS